jgi:hypothetical protein
MTGEAAWTAAAGVLAVLAVRIIDYVLPTGKHLPHLPWVDDDGPEEEEPEDAY